jgi:hypothetical protein
MSKTPYADQFVEFQDALQDYVYKSKIVEIAAAFGNLQESHREEAHKAKVKVLSLFNTQLTKNHCQEKLYSLL